PKTGKTRVRLVNIETEYYKIARRYMLRLRKDDFDNEDQLRKLASAVGLSVAAFRDEFEHVVKDEAPPLRFGV
ncbi:MAG TPA: hypothetical protein VFU02_04610, partial [Polyangiaceae bacterium]|nr:hypothetical protein [Polyangiaceae bacterium]